MPFVIALLLFPSLVLSSGTNTPDDIGRYIEERLKEELDMSAINEGLRADIRRIVPTKISGMYVLAEGAELRRLG